MKMTRRLAAVAAAAIAAVASAQPTSESPLAPRPNGPRTVDPGWHVLTGATVHIEPQRTVENAMVVIQSGRITGVYGPEVDFDPVGARVWDCEGLHVYPGFIDAFVEVDSPAPDPASPGVHAKSTVTPQRSALDGTGLDAATAKTLRSLGFTAAAISPRGGNVRGTAAVVSLAAAPVDPSAARPPVYRRVAYQTIGFDTARGRGGSGPPTGPTAQIGAIALIRQVLLDADWRAAGGDADKASCLDALTHDVPLAFVADHELESLRAAGLMRELNRRGIIVGCGTEFRRLDAIVADGVPHVIPLAFPEAPDVSSVGKAESVELRTLMTWEQAPTNPRRLDEAGLTVAITSSRAGGRGDNRGDFMEHLREAIRQGLKEERALAMLTTVPADLLGVGDSLGRIEEGRVANLIVADGPIFAKETKIRDVWIDGRRHEVTPPPAIDIAGDWEVSTDDPGIGAVNLEIRKGNAITVRIGEGEEAKSLKARSVELADNRLSFVVEDPETEQVSIVSCIVEKDAMTGSALVGGVRQVAWTAKRAPDAQQQAEEQPEGQAEEQPDDQPVGEVAQGERKEEKELPLAPEELGGYPFGPYAMPSIPPQETVAFVHGTVWTSGPDGVIEDGAVVIDGGRIVFVGTHADLGSFLSRAQFASPMREVDLAGRHVTPGLIDCHSHTGTWTGGTNETGEAITAEVWMGDANDPDAINWYRQLAGGITTVNTLHGSANAIGGQNLVQKVRWGVVHPRDTHVEGAIPGIKFALGENPRAVNWGEGMRWRYPQSRMGVEAIIRDRFTAARDYAEAWDHWHRVCSLEGKPPPRRDLELEAIAQILAGERLIHCHSYRQDEILMLCRLAGEFGFTIGTFQHVLEGYKVAEAIREHALGASAFSDWWAYKIEVQDAIPHNGAIMHEQGVVVSFNSDSDELARRMNAEAAKAVRYGGVPEAEALKFVTINAARQLAIDDMVGSIETGKDADLAIWSGPPLSTTSRCEATWIDGREYFSLDKDRAHRERIAAERNRLISRVLAGAGPSRPDGEGDSEGRRGRRPAWEQAYIEARREFFMDALRRGIDPATAGCGVCGCGEAHFFAEGRE